MKNTNIVSLAIALLVFAATSGLAQTSVNGTWEWTGPLGQDKMKDYLSITLKPRAGKVAGTFFYNQLDATAIPKAMAA